MLEVLVLQEYFKFNVFLCSSFKITAIHHSHRVTADEVNAGLRLLSDAEEKTFSERFRRHIWNEIFPKIPDFLSSGVPQQFRVAPCPDQGGCVECRQKDDDDEGDEKNAVPISSACSCHLRAASLRFICVVASG